MNDQHDLETIIKSRFPLITIETLEEQRAVNLLKRICILNEKALFAWDIVDGLVRIDGQRERIPATADPDALFRHLAKTPHNGIYALLDIGPHLDDPVRARVIKRVAQEFHRTARTLVLIGHELSLPPDLRRHTASFKLSLPDAKAIRAMLTEEAQLFAYETNTVVKTNRETINLVVQHLVGLCEADARRLIRHSLRDDGALSMDDIERIHRAKYDMLDDGGLLTLEMDTGSMRDMGGLQALKRWLELRKAAFTGDTRANGLSVPKGVLLLGVQGGGKSLAAKCVAGTWGVPLMRLDFGVLYNKFFGETERNLRNALATADTMSPCILWIDEIEKGLSSAANSLDGGVSRRVFGALLTWMAERTSRVFLVATANDISALPPELMRKGRFDEIFFVDLPSAAVRADIFRIHLERRKLAPEHFDLDTLAAAAAGFSGAEIEQAIVSSLYEAHNDSTQLATTHIQREIEATRPLSVVMAEKVAQLREWASHRAVMAN